MPDSPSVRPALTKAPLGWGRWIRGQLEAAKDTGYFGPNSAIWLIHREAVLALGLGQALLMQLAHPWVAQAVADHSTFRDEPIDRLAATVMAAEFLVFGDRAQADLAAANIRDVHTRIHGTLQEDVGRWRRGASYSAEDPDALLWVLVTLTHTAISVYESSLGPLPESVVRSYLDDAAHLGEMIGVTADSAPRRRSELEAYMDSMITGGTVAVGSLAREMAEHLLHPRLSRRPLLISWPYRVAARATAATLMPSELRLQYGHILAPPVPSAYRVGAEFGRRLLRRVPPGLRLDPISARTIRRAQCLQRS